MACMRRIFYGAKNYELFNVPVLAGSIPYKVLERRHDTLRTVKLS